VLDGEGGFCVYGTQIPAECSLAKGNLPLGLAQHVTLKREVAEGERLKWSDVHYDADAVAVRVRREMEAGARQPRAAPE
jgi:predicted homoserine dehydrogenase-like protein